MTPKGLSWWTHNAYVTLIIRVYPFVWWVASTRHATPKHLKLFFKSAAKIVKNFEISKCFDKKTAGYVIKHIPETFVARRRSLVLVVFG